MKKHLHGKRHSIARRSVSIGRERRRERKMMRFISLIKRIDMEQLVQRIADAFKVAASMISELSSQHLP